MQAYKVGLYGKKIVWIMYGFFSKTFWSINLEDIDCTAEEMSLVAEGTFLIKHANNNMDEQKGIANITCRCLLYVTFIDVSFEGVYS